LETKIKIIASGKIVSCFDILRVLALGANAVCTEMPGYRTIGGKTFSLYKSQNLIDFRNYLLKATVQAMEVCGFMNVIDITLSKVFRKLDMLHFKGFENLNGPVSYPGPVKKVYNSKVKSYQSREEKKGSAI
jgi:isopentenyl diphosphate isomerase/L-lactate dehydrogenase-like FMN-dependent dehydrogenase